MTMNSGLARAIAWSSLKGEAGLLPEMALSKSDALSMLLGWTTKRLIGEMSNAQPA